MKSRFLIFLSILMMCSSGAGAQVNGYLGKRFIAGYKAGLAINAAFIYGGALEGDDYFALRHTIHADYIVGPRVMLGGEFVYSPTGFTAEYTDKRSGDKLQYNISTNLTTYSAVLTFHGLAGKSVLSPVGDYFQFKLSQCNASFMDEHEVISETSTDKPFTGKMGSFGFGFGYGHNQVVMDNIVLDAGVELNIFPTAWSNEYSPNNTTGSTKADAFINRSITNYNAMVFRLGIGGLLF